MRFTTRHDVDMPADQLFDALADFDRLERMITSRKARITRLDPGDSPMAWDIEFNWRGKARKVRMRVTRFDRPQVIEMQGSAEALDLRVLAEVVALTQSRSRLDLTAEIAAQSMKGRLLLQTAKLTKSTLDRKFAERVADYVDGLSAA